MRGQSTQFNCGAAALYNALCAIGYTKHSLDDCEARCESDQVEGTPIKNLKKAIKSFGYEPRVIRSTDLGPELAFEKLDSWLECENPVILVVDDDAHWVAAIGRFGDRYLIADSAENELVLSYTPDELRERWFNPKSRVKYYGLVLK